MASRSAPKVNKFAFKRGDGYALRLDVLKDETYFTCEVKLPSDEKARSAAVAILSERRKSVEEAFGGELDWKESPDSSIFQIYQSIDGGWQSPESEWSAIQDRLIENLLRLGVGNPAVSPGTKAFCVAIPALVAQDGWDENAACSMYWNRAVGRVR